MTTLGPQFRAIVLPFGQIQPVEISFKDIHKKVFASPFTREKKEVLKGLTGSFKPGELSVIMGPSGAGKTTLLNLLTGFEALGPAGHVEMNGSQVNPAKKVNRRDSAYIMQDDNLNPHFTVSETMIMASALKLGCDISKKAREYMIDDILRSLNLCETKNTRCSQLSGGQKKRVSIALELIGNPTVMYFDEPTTGLDSRSSMQMVKVLRNLARTGRTVICTIHQPSAAQLELFDYVYVIGDGRCVYQGSSTNIVPFLEHVGLHCPKYHNPADFLMDAISGEFGNYLIKLQDAAKDPRWRSQFPTTVTNGSLKKGKEDETVVMIKQPSEMQKIWIIVKRYSIQQHRDWTMVYLKLIVHVAVAIVIGLLFQNSGESGDKVLTNLAFIMSVMVYLLFTSMIPAVLKFPSELSVVKKERFNNWYSFRTYFCSMLLVNVPILIVSTLLFTCISYVLTRQLIEWERTPYFMATIVLMTLIAESLGLALGAIKSVSNGIFIGSVSLAAMMILSGYGQKVDEMSFPLNYLSNLSIVRYGMESMMVITYGFNRTALDCPSTELYCHFRYPEKFLREFGLYEENLEYNTIILGIYLLFSVAGAYFILNWKIKRR